MTIQARGTFDEHRSQPQDCPCGRHKITGYLPPGLPCPYAPPHVGRWAQPDREQCE